MKYLRKFSDQNSAIGIYSTPLVCVLKNLIGNVLCASKKLGDKIEIEKDDDSFIKIKDSYFQFDVTKLDSIYKLKS